ncbi:hypothetical protein [Methylobacterium sp. 37f]|uniref:hypothetical protein n=1 Tax=Methylobacterium sp. 37f TaxID=2817058 RepID=UPI001FFD836B|nr:hypothetical protein [Methylobacterium sp. 37f]MCK2055279.1 hypothetical protein [Methylobacterium sp. 37f]
MKQVTIDELAKAVAAHAMRIIAETNDADPVGRRARLHGMLTDSLEMATRREARNDRRRVGRKRA